MRCAMCRRRRRQQRTVLYPSQHFITVRACWTVLAQGGRKVLKTNARQCSMYVWVFCLKEFVFVVRTWTDGRTWTQSNSGLNSSISPINSEWQTIVCNFTLGCIVEPLLAQVAFSLSLWVWLLLLLLLFLKRWEFRIPVGINITSQAMRKARLLPYLFD